MSLIKFVFLLLELCLLEVCGQNFGPMLKIQQGEIVGTYERYTGGKQSGGQYSVFRGIPYAQPPVDELRLKDPKKHEGWTTTLSATQFGSECPQWDIQGRVTGNEDCLFINIFTPFVPDSGTAPRTFYPVMVFLHGGNFQRGSSNPYAPGRFLEKGMVVVTLNYRLGILGFLSTGDGACPGNLGLKDQVLALQWVKDNIETFAGNKNLITLFGQDTGAASVFLHILSPMSKDLFHHAITQSGSPLCDWTVEENPNSFALEVANRLNCPTKSSWSMVDCIRKKEINDILNAQKANKIFGDYPFRAIAVVDKNGFLPDTPIKLLESTSNRIPLVSGVNKGDGAFFYPLVNSYREELRKNSSFLLTDLIPKFLLTATDLRGNIEVLSKTLLFEYFNEIDLLNITQVLQSFVYMTTDSMFVSCNHKTVQLYSSRGALTYMYAFEYRGENSMLTLEQKEPVSYDGVSHGDELLYLFNMEKAPLVTSSDKLLADQLLTLWVAFATTGKSQDAINYEFPKWEPFTDETKNYYRIDLRNELKTVYKQRAVTLWLSHLPSLANVTGNVRLEYKTGDFGWAMFAIALILLIAVIVLGVIVYRKSKSQYFEAQTENK